MWSRDGKRSSHRKIKNLQKLRVWREQTFQNGDPEEGTEDNDDGDIKVGG